MGVFDEIRETQTPKKPQQGLIWLSMLIEYDTNGKAVILRSFSRPASESGIKLAAKLKKEVYKPKKPTEVKTEDLF